ncbi:MAG: type II toxin-antitoxin system VapC family toxin [Armatimonadetes bacterium]|nr:type II toxin-antitoxin system VapC family toxin [Armatimonadota bacterium]
MNLVVPDTSFVELLRALVRAVVRIRFSFKEAGTTLRGLSAIPVRVQLTLPLINQAIDIALQHHKSVYDASVCVGRRGWSGTLDGR